MNIAIGADHRGYAYKEIIKKQMTQWNKTPIQWVDIGASSDERSDYPVFAQEAVRIMQNQHIDRGILICGSGIGMAVAANRYPGIYAGVAWNAEVARVSREHDNVNVLVIPSDFVNQEQAIEMIYAWLDAKFLRGRYAERIELIDGEK